MPRPFPYRPVALVLTGLAVALAADLPSRQEVAAADPKQPEPAAVERTRATVKMLDDLHKDYVVTITDTYVKAQEKTPAAAVVKQVFAHMEKNGYGTGRLIDA